MTAKKIIAILLAMAPSAKAQVCQCVPTTVTETSTTTTETTTSMCSVTTMDDIDYGLYAISSSEYCSTSTTTETSTTAPTSAPTSPPTPAPTDPTYAPTAAPTAPTYAPTAAPTGAPTSTSTMTTTTMTTMSCTCTTTTPPPTNAPTAPPTNAPTAAPPPTNAPTAAPTQAPTSAPTAAPTADTSTATSITATTTTATSFDVKVCAAIVPFEDLNNYSHEVTGTLYFGSSQLGSMIDANEAKAAGYKVGVADKCKQMLDGWSKEVAKTESSKGCCNPMEYELSLDDELLPDGAYYFVIMVKGNSGTYTSNGVTVAINDVDNLGEHDHGDNKQKVAGLAHSTSVAYTALAAAAAAAFFQ